MSANQRGGTGPKTKDSSQWQKHVPGTNILWLRDVLSTMLKDKDIDKSGNYVQLEAELGKKLHAVEQLIQARSHAQPQSAFQLIKSALDESWFSMKDIPETYETLVTTLRGAHPSPPVAPTSGQSSDHSIPSAEFEAGRLRSKKGVSIKAIQLAIEPFCLHECQMITLADVDSIENWRSWAEQQRFNIEQHVRLVLVPLMKFGCWYLICVHREDRTVRIYNSRANELPQVQLEEIAKAILRSANLIRDRITHVTEEWHAARITVSASSTSDGCTVLINHRYTSKLRIWTAACVCLSTLYTSSAAVHFLNDTQQACGGSSFLRSFSPT